MLRDLAKATATVCAALALAIAMVVALPSVASAAPCVIDPDYAGGPSITTNPSGTVQPGQQIEIIGTGFPAGCEVDIVINGTVIGTVTTSADGSFSFPYTIPSDFLGTLTIVITAGDFSQTITLQVVAPTVTTTAPPPLPVTGSDSDGMIGIGLALVALGGLLVLGTRKRRAEAAA